MPKLKFNWHPYKGAWGGEFEKADWYWKAGTPYLAEVWVWRADGFVEETKISLIKPPAEGRK